MRYEYIEPFVITTIKVLDRIIQADIAQGTASLVNSRQISGDVAIVVKVRGDSEGSIILNMQADTALNICRVMFGEDSSELSSQEMDCLGELANMIAGNATSALNDMGHDLGVLPPEVVTRDRMPSGVFDLEAFQIPLFTEYGEITMNISLRTN